MGPGKRMKILWVTKGLLRQGALRNHFVGNELSKGMIQTLACPGYFICHVAQTDITSYAIIQQHAITTFPGGWDPSSKNQLL